MRVVNTEAQIKRIIKKIVEKMSGLKIELHMLDVFRCGMQQMYSDAYLEYRADTLHISGANPLCWFRVCVDEVTSIKEFQTTRYEITLSGGMTVTISEFY